MTDDTPHVDRRPPGFPSVGGTSPEDDTSEALEKSPFLPPVAGQTPALLPAFASPDGPGDALEPVGGPGNAWRWVAALVATVGVIAVVVGVFLLAGPKVGAPSLVAHYVPADTHAYAELRLDLPGDQRDRVISFMSRFPGFADPSTFQQKLDETLQQALTSTGASFDWKTDVEPWFGGQVGIYQSTQAPSLTSFPANLVISVKDRQKLQGLIDARLPSVTASQREYAGHTVWTVTSPDSSRTISFTVTDDALLIAGTFVEIQTALDVKAGNASLADDPFLTQQLATFHSDRLATLYYDYAPVIGSMPSQLPGLPAGCLDYMKNLGNIKYVGELRAEADHLALTSRMQYPTGGGLPALPGNGRSALAETAPADTIAYVEMRQLGGTIGWIVGQALDCLGPSATGFSSAQIQQLLGVPPESFFDFVADGALIVTRQDGKYGGGLVATVDDETVARQRVERLLSAVRMLAAFGGGLTIEDQQHGDTTITIVTPSNLPADSPFHSLAVAVTGGRIYLGADDFVAQALDRNPSSSLATEPRFKSALTAAGVENAGITYLDIAALRDSLEGLIPAADRARYDTEVKPFLVPVDHLMIVGVNDGGFIVGHAFLYVE